MENKQEINNDLVIQRLDKRIYELVKSSGNHMTAKEIARALSSSKTDVNSILYRYENSIYTKDTDNYWSIIDGVEKFRTVPENHGTKWTLEEDIQLVNEYRLGKSLGWIAKEHGRTELAVAARLISNIEKLKLSDVSEELENE